MSHPLHLVDVLRMLGEKEVRFIIIGGVAMRLLGSAHMTDDIDIIYSRDQDNLNKLVNAIKPHKPTLTGADPDLPFIFDAATFKNTLNLTLTTDIGRLDLLGDASGADSFERLWPRSVVVEIQDIAVHVASLDDLIAMKRAANRPKDQLHLMELEAIRKIKNDELNH